MVFRFYELSFHNNDVEIIFEGFPRIMSATNSLFREFRRKLWCLWNRLYKGSAISDTTLICKSRVSSVVRNTKCEDPVNIRSVTDWMVWILIKFDAVAESYKTTLALKVTYTAL